MDWIKDEMLAEEHNIKPEDLNIFTLVDTSEEAVDYIVKFYSRYLLSPNFWFIWGFNQITLYKFKYIHETIVA